MKHGTPGRVLLLNALVACKRPLTYSALLTAVMAQVKMHWPRNRNPQAAAEAILATPLWDYAREMTLIDLLTLEDQT